MTFAKPTITATMANSNKFSKTWLKKIGRFFHRMAWIQQTPTSNGPFVLGYITALNDIERTGLRPMTNKTRRQAAQKAFDRTMP